MPYHNQVKEAPEGINGHNACGPTALLMLLEYMSLETSLSSVIELTRQIAPQQGGFDDTCSDNPVCTSGGVLAQIAHNSYGLSVKSGDGWSQDELWNALAADNPIIVLVRTKMELSGFGHFVVVYGLDLDENLVYYQDPYEGANKEVEWDTFDEVWQSKIDKNDPLQPEGHVRWGMSGS